MERQIKKFDRQEINELYIEIQSALDKIKIKYGLADLSLGSVNFTMFSFSGKITGTVPEYQDFAKTYSTLEAQHFASTHGLPEDILSRAFIYNGIKHTIIRIESKNLKYPIITQCAETGKNYKFSVQIIKEILERIR